MLNLIIGLCLKYFSYLFHKKIIFIKLFFPFKIFQMKLWKLFLWFRNSSRKFEKASRALKIDFQKPWTSRNESRFFSRWPTFFLKKKSNWRSRNPPQKLKPQKCFKIWLTVCGKVKVTWPMKICKPSMCHCSLSTRIKIWLDHFFFVYLQRRMQM